MKNQGKDQTVLTPGKNKRLKKDLIISKGSVFSHITPGTKHEYYDNNFYELVFGLSDNTSGSLTYCIDDDFDNEEMTDFFEDVDV